MRIRLATALATLAVLVLQACTPNPDRRVMIANYVRLLAAMGRDQA